MVPSHLVRAKIEQARASGAFEVSRPSDEARVLAELERLLAVLPRSRGAHAVRLRQQIDSCTSALSRVYARSGQSVLADAMV